MSNYLPTFPAINIGGTIIGTTSSTWEGNVEAIGFAWRYLDHDDLWIRHAARVALEYQPECRLKKYHN